MTAALELELEQAPADFDTCPTCGTPTIGGGGTYQLTLECSACRPAPGWSAKDRREGREIAARWTAINVYGHDPHGFKIGEHIGESRTACRRCGARAQINVRPDGSVTAAGALLEVHCGQEAMTL